MLEMPILQREGSEIMTSKKVMISVSPKILDIIDNLVKEGDYTNRSQFINEALLSHLRTWYEKRLEKEAKSP
jgi:Arc/MetJ-type ribon-helix-helix transcriptional regulator